MASPWNHSSPMIPHTALISDQDADQYIDPQVLTCQGGWIQRSPAELAANSLVTRNESKAESDSNHAACHLRDRLIEFNSQHAGSRGDQLSLSPTPSFLLNPIAPDFIPEQLYSMSAPSTSSDRSRGLLLQEPVEVKNQQAGQVGQTLPAFFHHNSTKPCQDRRSLLHPSAANRTRGHSNSRICPLPTSHPQSGSVLESSPAPVPQDMLLQSPMDFLSGLSYVASDRSAEESSLGSRKPISKPYAAAISHPTPNHDPETPPPPKRRQGSYFCTATGCKEQTIPFPTISDLKHHQRKHIAKDKRPHACPDCSMRFQYPKDVRRHRKAKGHNGDPLSTCFVCNKVLSRNDNLLRHLASQHNIGETSSIVSGSSAESQPSASPSAISDIAYSYASPPSSGPSAPWSPNVVGSANRLALPHLHDYDDPFFDSSPQFRTTSVPMARWRTN